MKTNERRPGSGSGADVSAGAETTTTVQGSQPPAPDVAHQLTSDPATWDTYVAGYEVGYGAGLERGRQQAEDDIARHWSALAARIRRMANQPTIQELAARRAG